MRSAGPATTAATCVRRGIARTRLRIIELVFIMSNIIPQASLQNQNIWANFENYCRQTFLPGGKELLILCGPSLFTSSKLDSNHVTIPGYTWKIVVVVPGGAGTATNRISPMTQVIALRIPNTATVAYDAWQNYRTNVVAIESDTGFTFFTALPANLATVLRNKVDGQSPPAPALTSFWPESGQYDSSVTITGTNLAFATNVTFNGASASFTIGSTTQVVATVPFGATSGLIEVQTLGGTATSSSSFTVGTMIATDLAIAATHTGAFTQGDVGDAYTIIVTNAADTTSSGTVVVADTLPIGLAATSIGGTGWTADLGTLTCTRSDGLAAGAAYPPITVVVNVAADAAPNVTNTVTLFSGGDTNLSNNTAIDPTTITPSSTGDGLVTLVGWDMHSLPGGADNYGPSPLPPTVSAVGVAVAGLTRGSGIGTNNSGAQRAWGGNNWTNTSAALAIASNRFATFSIAANVNNKVSCSAISRFDYRHSATGPSNGLLQYQLGADSFNDIATFAYPTNTSTGAALPSINLSGITALQDVGAGTNITFRIVNWGGTSSSGTWYIFDVSNSIALDFEVRGTVSPAVEPLTPIQLWRLQWFGTTADFGAAADSAIAANGMPNLLSYALGLDPLVPTNNPVVADIDTGYLRLTVPRNPDATDVSFHVELSDSLEPAAWTTNGTIVVSNSPALLQVRENAPVDSSAGRFMRIHVSRP